MKKILFLLLGVGLLTGCSVDVLNNDNDFCKGCVFGNSSTSFNKKLPEDYSKDYSELGNVFLGQIVKDGVVKRSFACGIEQGKPFCLEALDYMDYSSDKDAVIKANKKVLDDVFQNCGMDSAGEDFYCYGTDVYVYFSNNFANVVDNSTEKSCSINSTSFCLD